MSHEQSLFLERTTETGEQRVYKFANGYGASVVRGRFTYGGDKGLFELAVVAFGENDKWHLTHETPITNDVLGHLSVADVNFQLDQIAALPSQVTK